MKKIQQLIVSIIKIGVKEEFSFVKKRNIQITNGLSLVLILIDLLFLLTLFGISDPKEIIKLLMINIISLVPSFISLSLSQRGHYISARFLIFGYYVLFLSVLPFLLESNSGDYLHFISLMIGAVLLFNNKKLAAFLFLSVGLFFIASTYIALFAQDYFGFINDPLDFIINIITFFGLLYFLLQSFKSESQSYQFQIEEKNKLLFDKNQQISQSIDYALRIQNAIIPEFKDFKKGFPESFVFYQPRDVVSGDFYWFQEIEDEWIFAVGDCTGHGVPGALMSMLGISFLEQIVIEKNITEPYLILQNLDILIRKTLKQEKSDNQDGLDIAICKINKKQRVLQFAGANNPLWIIKNQSLEVIKGTKIGIGGRYKTKNKEFQNHQFNFEEGTSFYLMSDGYQDQFGGVKNKKFGSKQLKEFIFKNHQKSAKEQELLLKTHFFSWIEEGKENQIDDVTLLGVKV